MDYRSHTTRPNRARSPWLGWAALALLGVCGCQSNAERDLIARDRRMQEDQLYAMQDYISQYQQLVCRYRSENASLRRKLAYECDVAPGVREPQPMPRTPTPATNNGPKIEVPPTPGTEKKRSPTPELEMPDVPPLKQGTSAGNGREQMSHVLAASYDDSINGSHAPRGEVASASGQVAARAAHDAGSSPEILLSGEVVANDSGGPRLVVDIEPFDRSGHIAPFEGNVSLMLVASTGDGRQRKLARWDFESNEVRSAVTATSSEPTMRFRVELPAGMPVGEATELWVRLVPSSGGKVLSHAKIDLSQPGVFSSRTDKIWPSEEAVVAASYEEPANRPSEAPITVNEGAWATAQPGKPANLPVESDRAGGGWKASSEFMPAAIANTAPTVPVRNASPSASEPNSNSAAMAEVGPKPAWVPERPGSPSHGRSSSGESRAATRPSWSATR